MIDKGVRTFKQEVANKEIKLKERISLKEEQLFVIQTLYDLSSEDNITPEKWNSMDTDKKESLFPFIAEGNIKNCLNKRSAFEGRLFEENVDKKKIEDLKESIYQSVKEALHCLEPAKNN